MPQTNAVPTGEPVIRTVAMPADTNPAGDIFGGWLMAQMDLAAGNAAARRARGRCATVAADSMVFHSPVFVGDEVSLFADILRVGRTSLSIRIEAWRRDYNEHRPHSALGHLTPSEYANRGQDRAAEAIDS